MTGREWCRITSGRTCPKDLRRCSLWFPGIGCPYVPGCPTATTASAQHAISGRTGQRRGNGKKSIRRGLR